MNGEASGHIAWNQEGVQLQFSTGRRGVSSRIKLLRNFFTGLFSLIVWLMSCFLLDNLVLPKGLLSEFGKKEAKTEKVSSHKPLISLFTSNSHYNRINISIVNRVETSGLLESRLCLVYSTLNSSDTQLLFRFWRQKYFRSLRCKKFMHDLYNNLHSYR